MLPINQMPAVLFEPLAEERREALQDRAPNNLQPNVADLDNIRGRLAAQPQPLAFVALNMAMRSIKFLL